MFANLLIALREGLEAALVVSIIVAYLVKSGRRDALPKLWLGVGLAALIPLVAGAIMTWGPKTLTFQGQEILGGTLSFVAVGLVTWMIFWMGKNARELKGELEGSLSKSLSAGSSGWGIVWIAVVAVGREGVETALFVWATVRSSIETSAMQATVGVIAGLAIAIVLGVLIYQGAVRINLRVFFAVTGYFLVVVAAGIIAYGIGDLQEAGLLEVSDAVGDDAGGDDDEEVAGHGEEDAQVDAHRALIDEDTQHDGDGQSRNDAHCRLHGGGLDAGAHGGPHEQGGLHPLAPDGDDGDPDDAPAGAACREGLGQ